VPGMSTGLSTNNPVVFSAFCSELVRRGLAAALAGTVKTVLRAS